jgi:cytochrome P450
MKTVRSPYAYPIEGATPHATLNPLYHQLREQDPVAKVTLPKGTPAWLVSRYDDVVQVLMDDDVFSLFEANRVPDYPPIDKMLLGMQPADHRRIRGAVQRAFTTRRVELLRARTQQRVSSLLDAMQERGEPADLVESLALPLTLDTVGELLGVPEEGRRQFTTLGNALLAGNPDNAEEIGGALAGLGGYIYQLISLRRSQPADDLISDLIAEGATAAEAGQELMSDEEFVSLGILLVMAGWAPTASLIGQCCLDLATSPDHLAYLHKNPDAIEAAAREFTRVYPVGSDDGRPRVATRDVELSGVLIRKGDVVLAAHDAANFDVSKFSDPAVIDLGRRPNRHLSFGHGPHVCMGAALALMEVEAVLTALADQDRFPDLRLAVPAGQIDWLTGVSIRGPVAIPVAWSPRPSTRAVPVL